MELVRYVTSNVNLKRGIMVRVFLVLAWVCLCAMKWPSDDSTWRWDDVLASARGSGDAVAHVNERVNRIRYVWEARDHWASPTTFRDEGGDCEEYAVTKFLLLSELVPDPEALRVYIVMSRRSGLQHAVTAYRDVVLDSEYADPQPLSAYRPLLRILPGGAIVNP